MTEFTPFTSFSGGMLIGLAAVLLMAFHGRILGATGILSGLMRSGDGRDWSLRAVMLLGMVLAPGLILLATGTWPAMEVPVSMAAIIGGGLLVGIGVSYGGGCTSGHGVCGNARLSRRSITATISFMLAAFVTVYVTRHLIGA
ncbi:YeeE/YedE family protein [Xinfangfangia sp. CPCC 101601]|uniref:YeeE/YedE-like protein n=2 Tax=Paracoccaceae TaxID=31989 RepID=S5Y802_PARAH|nr:MULTISPECIES: YeeE/YedE thiosulfate transporter family protein [Paracoccaceae]AGT11645.1 YeeE/YedE-like protein [Paracoccus aminophilus JCM 7686]MDQ2067156.1 YeeE/YedE family protein [Xinfangfangia sp. CPCC 101601]